MSWQQNEKEKYLYTVFRIYLCVLYMLRIRLLKVDRYAVGAEVLLLFRRSHGPTD